MAKKKAATRKSPAKRKRTPAAASVATAKKKKKAAIKKANGGKTTPRKKKPQVLRRSVGHVINKAFDPEAADIILGARLMAKQAGYKKASVTHLCLALGGHVLSQLSAALGEDANLMDILKNDSTDQPGNGAAS